MKRQAPPEPPQHEKQSKKSEEVLSCGFLHCSKPILDYEQTVHVCCGPLKRKLNSAVINWNQQTGKAILHGACWRLLADRREISPQERALIKIATKTAEFHDPEKDVQEKAALFVELLRSANHLVVFTGAGISTSAGIGDYRGISGKWTTEDLQVESEDLDDGVPYEELRPTYAHEALVKLQDLGHLKHVISQNCDGLHLLSGIKKENISEVHGNVFQEYCPKCNKTYSRKFYVLNDDSQEKDCPRCELDHRTERKCTAKVKRGNKTVTCKTVLHDTIINFGDLLNEEILDRAQSHARQCDLFLSLGSSMLVTPAATLVENAKAYVICNRQVTEYDDGATIRVWGDIDPFMKMVMKKLLGEEQEKIWCDSLASKKAHYDSMRKN